MNWFDELKTDRNALRQAQKEWRKNHFLLWLGDRAANIVFIGFIFLVGYIGGAGIIDSDASGARTVVGLNLDTDQWDVIDGTKEYSLEGAAWAKREYLVCSYDSFTGPIIRRYWIGQTIESSRNLSKLERLELDKTLTDHFGDSFGTYDRKSYDREMASAAALNSGRVVLSLQRAQRYLPRRVCRKRKAPHDRDSGRSDQSVSALIIAWVFRRPTTSSLALSQTCVVPGRGAVVGS